MIKFFRKIRQNLLTENKFSKYLLYAVGEIILVVIGILIALAINNWNNEKQQKNQLINNFENILEEISITRSLTQENLKAVDAVIQKNQMSLRLLKSQNIDSAYQLKSTLGALIDLQSFKFELPITMQFIEDDNTKKLKNLNLKKLALKLKSEVSFLEFYTNYATTQYQSLIEPYVVKNLNHAEIQTLSTSINTGTAINYTNLFNDLELANILNLKLETDVGASSKLKELNLILEKLEEEIQQELSRN